MHFYGRPCEPPPALLELEELALLGLEEWEEPPPYEPEPEE
jgi:hypothetical protein